MEYLHVHISEHLEYAAEHKSSEDSTSYLSLAAISSLHFCVFPSGVLQRATKFDVDCHIPLGTLISFSQGGNTRARGTIVKSQTVQNQSFVGY